jgi:hypothetical protein
MANVQIPNLGAAIALSGSEELEIVQAGVSRRATTQQIANLAPIAGGPLGYYGSFYDTTTQTGSLTEAAVNIGSTWLSNQITISNSSRVNFLAAGTYSITFSIQFTNGDNNTLHTADMWLKKNGFSLAASNSRTDIHGRHSGRDGATLSAVDFLLTFAANDYIELYWLVDNVNVKITTLAAVGSVPETPGVILNAISVAS